ncbi:MAG: Cof-type HAD-IIB family hydrolase [Candidatus Izemoplasmataceae bacterium]
MIKLIVFDLDNTLLKDDKSISIKTLKTLQKLKAMQIDFTIASGRAEALIYPFVKMLNINQYALVNNGTTIKNLLSKEVLQENYLNQRVKNSILKDAFLKNIDFTLYAQGRFYTNSQSRVEFYNQWNLNNKEAYIDYVEVASLDDVKAIKVDKILLIIENEIVINDYYDKLSKRNDCHVTKSQEYFLDIMPKGINKGTSLAMLAEHLGLKKDEIMVFGDHDNDAEMLAYAAYSVAMPNGSLKARESAKFIALDNNNQDGVRKTLEHFFQEGILKPLNE